MFFLASIKQRQKGPRPAVGVVWLMMMVMKVKLYRSARVRPSMPCLHAYASATVKGLGNVNVYVNSGNVFSIVPGQPLCQIWFH